MEALVTKRYAGRVADPIVVYDVLPGASSNHSYTYGATPVELSVVLIIAYSPVFNNQ